MAMWRHDKAYSDSILSAKASVFESMVCIGDNSNEGVTHAQIFTVPREQEDMARQFYDEISRMALQFTEGNLDVSYRYNYLIFDESYWGDILTSANRQLNKWPAPCSAMTYLTPFWLPHKHIKDKTLNICSYFHPRQPLLGYRRGFFMSFFVILLAIFSLLFSSSFEYDKNIG